MAASTGCTLYFRDTRYTVTSTDVRVETQLTSSVAADDMSMSVDDTTGFYAGCTVIVERTGTNEESIHLAGVGATLVGWVRVGHPSGSYVTRKSTLFRSGPEVHCADQRRRARRLPAGMVPTRAA